jgi:hypothetical protein
MFTIIILQWFGLVVRCVPHLRLPLSLSTARGAITTSLMLVNATARCKAEPKPDTEIRLRHACAKNNTRRVKIPKNKIAPDWGTTTATPSHKGQNYSM